MITTYLVGLASMTGILLYIYLFNLVWTKLNRGDLDGLGYFIVPFLIPVCIGAVLTIPFMIGSSILN